MSRHYWPTEPGWYLVEYYDGSVERLRFHPSGYWLCLASAPTTETLQDDGYLGVRTPFSEEAERAAFEECFKGKMYFDRDEDGEYVDWHTGFAWLGWLEAKRHERGL